MAYPKALYPLGIFIQHFVFRILDKQKVPDIRTLASLGPGLLKNGAGKVFFYEMLKIIPHRQYKICISTTGHSGFDWCVIREILWVV